MVAAKKTHQKPKRDWSQFNGTAFLISVLKSADPATRAKWIASIRERSKILGLLIDKTEFVFMDLAKVDASCLAKLWGSVSEKDMAIAWKLMESPLKQHLIQGLSKRRQEQFAELCARQPKMPRRQVVRVQQAIARQVHQLVCRGVILLTSRRYGEVPTGLGSPPSTGVKSR